MGTLEDVAKEVGISAASISIYLNDKSTKRVSETTKKRIDEAIVKLNYHRNMFARSLATSRSRLVGLLFPTVQPMFQNFFSNEVLSGIQSRLSQEGYGIVFFPSLSETSSVSILQKQLRSSVGCDGYILFSTGFCTEKQSKCNIEEIMKLSLPFVTVNNPEFPKPINQILIEGVTQATGLEYLIRKGHKNIITIMGRKDGQTSEILYHDVMNLLEKHGLAHAKERIRFGEYDMDISYTVTLEVLQKYPDTTAICCMSDDMAIQAIHAANHLGFKVPEDLSVIGRNNSSVAKLSGMGLTTVDLHMFQAGCSAVNLLLDSFKGNTAIQQIHIKDTIIEKDSVSDVGNYPLL